jgi:hypothetical protein
MGSDRDSGPTRAEPPLLSARGLYLPSWTIALVGSALVAVVSLAVESRVRLGQHEQTLRELHQQISAVSADTRAEQHVLVEELTKLKISVAAICAATQARCP